MSYFRSGFQNMPPVVKNLLVINVIFFIATIFFDTGAASMFNILALHYVGSPLFMPHQIATHMFMHAGFAHIAFNMFGLWMFGSTLEQVWGPKRFLTFYLITALGAAGLYQLFTFYEIQSLMAEMTQLEIDRVFEDGHEIALDPYHAYTLQAMNKLNAHLNGAMVGASGAISGLLLAFAVLFPNTELMLIFFPVPIKAKYFVPGLIIIETYLGVQQFDWDNIAHFAHLGGMLMGFILLKIWQRDRKRFY